MTTAGETEQRVPLFSMVNLILLALCVGVFVAAVSAGVKTGSLAGIITGVVLGIVIVPIVFVAGFYALALIAAVLFLLFGGPEIEVTGWLARVRTVLRWAVAAGAVLCIGFALPHVWRAKTLHALRDIAALGLLIPASVLFLLVLPRLERLTRRQEQAADPPVEDG